jgi:poly-gamma-glutamate synthesis protein (capsule biosynthesis protein)
LKLALIGDVMLGRGVAQRLQREGPRSLFADELVAVVHEADIALANLECCISERGRPADKRFVFRAPPSAVESLVHLGVTAVTLANNHSLDYGADALMDTLGHLDAGGIAHVGAGADLEQARRPILLHSQAARIRVVACTDHPVEFAAASNRPGVAFADFANEERPTWLLDVLINPDSVPLLVTAHWGPNMHLTPVAHVRGAAAWLVRAGATLVAGHSAHVFQGMSSGCLYDLGDFVDDYARDAVLRNDWGMLVLVTFDDARPVRVEVVPLELEYCFTKLATGAALERIARRFTALCREMGTSVARAGDRIVIDWSTAAWP